jgi:hypothetical protein
MIARTNRAMRKRGPRTAPATQARDGDEDEMVEGVDSAIGVAIMGVRRGLFVMEDYLTYLLWLERRL